jgi:aspartyl-tRNA(Asn)/glutamyl-tRNA(Gln) amidotransferase subunit A
VADAGPRLRARELSASSWRRPWAGASMPHAGLGAFLPVDETLTLAQARAADARLAAGDGAPLLGVPIAHKDIFVTRGLASTAGSKMLQATPAPSTPPWSTGWRRPARHAGQAELRRVRDGLGQRELGLRAGAQPLGPARVPGGSSGGSAAAVAARLLPAATGTDTGGSIRQPASFCGVTGIKPTYGVCSRYGMVAFASSLDQAGPLARSAEDCALLLSAMSGFDVRDATSAERPPQDFHAADARAARRRHGRPAAAGPAHRPAAGVLPRRAGRRRERRGARRAGRAGKLGATLVDVSLPRTELSIPVYYIIAPAEASSNLGRFDGVKFGHRAADHGDLLDMYKKTRAQGFGPEVKRRIMIGTYVLSHGYYDAYYLQAQKLRRMIADDFQACFRQCDLIAGPVAPTVAWKLGAQGDDPVKAYLADIFTLPASLAGLPGMSVPAGFGDGGLPVGLQLIGNYFQEGRCCTRRTRCSRPPTSTPGLRPGTEHDRLPLIRGYEVVIGLETHAQLSTASKIFSGASTAFGAEPNTQACAVDLALPGTLPVMNRGAVERAIRFGLAVGATVAPLSIFARKNYFYPDLPKGYQISQYEIPVVQGGRRSTSCWASAGSRCA